VKPEHTGLNRPILEERLCTIEQSERLRGSARGPERQQDRRGRHHQRDDRQQPTTHQTLTRAIARCAARF
jgi:hypothetical protein